MVTRTLISALLTLSGAAIGAQPSAQAGGTDAAACYAISDADARTYCLARARRDSGTCYAIQRPDLRTLCLAEVRR